MRCLSLFQPWARLVVEGVKTVETRGWPWPAKYLGVEVVICSTKRFHVGAWPTGLALAVADLDHGDGLASYPDGPGWLHGYALGTVRVVGSTPTERVYPAEAPDYELTGFTGESAETGDAGWAWADVGGELTGDVVATERERALGDYSEGRFAYLLAKPRRFAEPVRVRGRQRIWTPSYTEHALIEDQMKAVAA